MTRVIIFRGLVSALIGLEEEEVLAVAK